MHVPLFILVIQSQILYGLHCELDPTDALARVPDACNLPELDRPDKFNCGNSLPPSLDRHPYNSMASRHFLSGLDRTVAVHVLGSLFSSQVATHLLHHARCRQGGSWHTPLQTAAPAYSLAEQYCCHRSSNMAERAMTACPALP